MISDNHRNKFAVPPYPGEQFRFGDIYEENMFSLIHKYLELGTTDRFCYVGEEKGSFAPLIERKFCLLHPVVSVIPGRVLYEETPTKRVIPVHYADVGAAEYFKQSATECKTFTRTLFDRVLIKDSLHYLQHPLLLFQQIRACLPTDGKLVIVHRPAMMNTLPYFKDAVKRLQETDVDFMTTVRELQSAGFDVQWEIENVPVLMPKHKWLSMVKHKFPPQLEIIGNMEIHCGLRELSEGVLKYEDEMVEFMDRLLFITATPADDGTTLPLIKRYGTIGYQPAPGLKDLTYKLDVTPDIKRLMSAKKSKGTTLW